MKHLTILVILFLSRDSMAEEKCYRLYNSDKEFRSDALGPDTGHEEIGCRSYESHFGCGQTLKEISLILGDRCALDFDFLGRREEFCDEGKKIHVIHWRCQ